MESVRFDMDTPVMGGRGVGLLYCGISRYDDSWGSVLHSHANAELFYVTRGQGHLQIADELITLSPNVCFLINPYVMHTEFSSRTDPLEYFVVGVKRASFHVEEGSQRYSIVGDRSNQRVLLPYFQDLVRELSAAQAGYHDVCAGILDILLLKMSRWAKIDVAATDGERISTECAEAKRLIDEHFQDPITLDWLAQQAGISKYYLSRTFRSSFGFSPMQYLAQRRVMEARHLLATTDHSQDVIAMLSGFSSPSYFSQAFKRVAGMNPSEYRRTLKQGS